MEKQIEKKRYFYISVLGEDENDKSAFAVFAVEQENYPSIYDCEKFGKRKKLHSLFVIGITEMTEDDFKIFTSYPLKGKKGKWAFRDGLSNLIV